MNGKVKPLKSKASNPHKTMGDSTRHMVLAAEESLKKLGTELNELLAKKKESQELIALIDKRILQVNGGIIEINALIPRKA